MKAIVAVLAAWPIEELFAWNTARAILKLIVVVPVIAMTLKDTKFHRWLMMVIFAICTPLIFLVNLYYYQNILVDNVVFAKDVCELMGSIGRLAG